ncbi:acyltransferase family protein [Clostridium butyricum]|uniref:Acyltransferase family protein n=1 Tax=Clostridium butyricum TaxID=1492 RepID=A0A6L9ETK0_CLOBU|nr:acyltransferase family protein [Clostridium butyricum]
MKQRNLGLDIVRSIAIIFVLVSHSRMFFQNYDLQFLSICGLVGVEIFFVLSGFLIGKIIINELVDNPCMDSLKNFYVRRWFRTLPLYYLVLFLVSFINNQSIPHRNYIFMQNFNENALGFLAVSWSLSVEEWFYVLVPAIVILSIKLLGEKYDKKKIFFIVAILIGITSFMLRFYTVIKYNPTWDYGVRKQVFLRMDAMMAGVILSGIKIYYNDFYKRISLSKLPAILSIIGFIGVAYIYILKLQSGKVFDMFIWPKIFIFNLISISSMFFILWFETNELINKSIIKYKISKVFNFISITSYGIYLIHYNIYIMLSAKYQGITYLAISIILTIILAVVLNKYYEIPIMNFRDKIKFNRRTTMQTEERV